MGDELRLPAVARGRHDSDAGGVGGDRGAVVEADEVEAEVEPGRRAGARQQLAVVDVEDVRVDRDRRVPPGQLLGPEPVGRRPQPVEQPRLGEREGADADRGDPRPPPCRRSQRREHRRRRRRERILDPGHDDRVRLRERVEPMRRADREQPSAGEDTRPRRADERPIGRPPVLQPHPPEHVERCREVGRHDPVEREHGDDMRPPAHVRPASVRPVGVRRARVRPARACLAHPSMPRHRRILTLARIR